MNECHECNDEGAAQYLRFIDLEDQEHVYCRDCWLNFRADGPNAVLREHGIDLLELPGLGGKLARRVAQKWNNAKRRNAMLTENAYLLIELGGFGFTKADRIAMHLGLSPNSPRRREAATRYVLDEASRDGHTWQSVAEATQAVRDLQLEPLFEQQGLIREGERVALSSLYHAEKKVAEMLQRMLDYLPWADSIQYGELQADQRAALGILLSQRVSVLLGAAGTGKTTLIKTLLDNIRGHRKSFALAAPTGKAARRMAEATGEKAKTIHRLLEATGDGLGGFIFQRDEDNKLDYDWIIIDEASMLDVRLMRSLLLAIDHRYTRLVLVGDPWQLPSVGPGDVLRDVTHPYIAEDGTADGYGELPYVELTTLKRQEPGELLARNCAHVRAGAMIEIDNAKAVDCFFADQRADTRIIEEIVDLVANPKRLQARFGIQSEQIQVLCALREKGKVSTASLNAALRAKLNPEHCKAEGFAPGDRIIQTRNNYDLGVDGVMNGELGTVKKILKKGEIVVKFDLLDDEVEIPYHQRFDLDFAWALTCHKAQGSEWPAVIIPIHKSNGRQVPRRRWMYTALSRGKQCSVMIGDRGELARIIASTQDVSRQTNLRRFLNEVARRASRPLTIKQDDGQVVEI